MTATSLTAVPADGAARQLPVESPTRRVDVLGVPVDDLDMEATLAWVELCVRDRRPGGYLCVNAANVVRANEDPAYRALLEQADVLGADGQPVLWAARLLGHPLPERVTGIDLMERVLLRAKDAGWAVYLVGAREHVVQQLAAWLSSDGVRVVGRRNGYFDPGQAREVAAAAAESGADVVFVGLPSPLKEQFVVDAAGPAGIPVAIGVGGSFDVLAGELRRAPHFLQRIGCEWLFRLVQEPRRLFVRYATTNAKFVALADRSILQRRRSDAG